MSIEGVQDVQSRPVTEPVVKHVTDVSAQGTATRDQGFIQQYWLQSLFIFMGAILLVLLSVYASKTYLGSVYPQLAVLDVQPEVRDRQAQFADLLKMANSEVDRKIAQDSIAQSMEQINQVVAELSKDCRCLLVLRGAIYNPEAVPDLTTEFQSRLRALTALRTPSINPAASTGQDKK